MRESYAPSLAFMPSGKPAPARAGRHSERSPCKAQAQRGIAGRCHSERSAGGAEARNRTRPGREAPLPGWLRFLASAAFAAPLGMTACWKLGSDSNYKRWKCCGWDRTM